MLETFNMIKLFVYQTYNECKYVSNFRCLVSKYQDFEIKYISHKDQHYVHSGTIEIGIYNPDWNIENITIIETNPLHTSYHPSLDRTKFSYSIKYKNQERIFPETSEKDFHRSWYNEREFIGVIKKTMREIKISLLS